MRQCLLHDKMFMAQGVDPNVEMTVVNLPLAIDKPFDLPVRIWEPVELFPSDVFVSTSLTAWCTYRTRVTPKWYLKKLIDKYNGKQ